MTRRIILLLIFVICFVAIVFFRDTDQDLWHWYWYLPLYEAIDVGYPEKTALIYKSSSKNIIRNIQLSWDILSVSHNDDFIVVMMFEDSKNICYILDKKKDQRYGPLTMNEFESYVETLQIPKKLRCWK